MAAVLVAAVDTIDCPAARALATEGVAFEVETLGHDDFAYGRALARLWSRGGELIVVEHDIVPWPGAISAISGCDAPWCAYQFPPNPQQLEWALGCLRVSERIVRAHPDAPQVWEGEPWYRLDAKVIQALVAASGRGDPHLHEPPLAQLKAHGWLSGE